MVDDYCFLEDVGRKVGEWGREIVKGGFDMSVRGRGVRMVGRGRNRRGGAVRMGRTGKGRGKGKREVLKTLLEARDIELELLPCGMERRRLNQSVWDQKYAIFYSSFTHTHIYEFDRNQTALLTIEFKFHPSTTEAPFASLDNVKPFTLLTHRNKISMPLLGLVQKHIQERMHKKSNVLGGAPSNSFPSWISSLVIPPPEDPENFTVPTFVMTAPSDPSLLVRSAALLSTSASTQKRRTPECVKSKIYYSLDPNEPLATSLRGTQFVEFPLIEVWGEFNGVIIDKKTGGVRYTGGKEEPQRKRIKLNSEEGKKTMIGLVGDYGSDDDEREQNYTEYTKLVGYVESDAEEDGIVDDEDEWTDADAEGEIDLDADPAIILKLMEQAKREGKWIEQSDDEEDDSDDSGGQGSDSLGGCLMYSDILSTKVK